MLTMTSRAIAAAAVAAIALSTVGLQPAVADGLPVDGTAPPPDYAPQYAPRYAPPIVDGPPVIYGPPIVLRRPPIYAYTDYPYAYGPVYRGPVFVPQGHYWRHHHHR